MVSITWSLGVGYVGYANQVGVSKLGAGRCWLCWLSKTNRQHSQHHAAVRAQRFAGGWRLLAMLALLTPVLNRSKVNINLRHASSQYANCKEFPYKYQNPKCSN